MSSAHGRHGGETSRRQPTSNCTFCANDRATGNENAFTDASSQQGLSELGLGFIGGLIHSADALAALLNPTVNTYKRINAPRTVSGATWAPSSVTWAGNNRTHMIRVPEGDRFELRLADGAANPYLMPAAVLATGLDGIDNGRDPGKRR